MPSNVLTLQVAYQQQRLHNCLSQVRYEDQTNLWMPLCVACETCLIK